MRLERHLTDLASEAMQRTTGETAPPLVRPTQDPKHGDYQINGALPLAKKLGVSPRELATNLAAALRGMDGIEAADVAGPGFVNLRLSNAWIASRLDAQRTSDRDGVPEVAEKETIVVDFSGPNIAKQMHVGHIRSTVLGDAICRVLRFVGHRVIGDNHLGDWGTQFGLLIVGMREWGSTDALDQDAIAELERVYKLASTRAKEDPHFAEAARRELAKLQRGDPENRALWERFVAATRHTLDGVYGRLDVHFDAWLGESAYHDMLPGVVEALVDAGLAREDAGALCVFFSEHEGAPKELRASKEPFIVRKRDGAYLYSTTDLATLAYRREHFGADRCVYVVDVRQSLHFKQLFAVAAMLGIPMKLEHVGFGTILGIDGKPLRTRDGATIPLAELLDEAVARATAKLREQLAEGRIELEDHELDEVARKVGIGAVKYADLRQNRMSDYQFDWDKLVSFQGNAGPYLQYANARIRSIFRKGQIDRDAIATDGSPIAISADAEAKLARTLLRFGDVVHAAAESHQPHLICEHLYDLAKSLSTFYENCPVLRAEGAVRGSRLALLHLTSKQLERGLSLLGIAVVDRM